MAKCPEESHWDPLMDGEDLPKAIQELDPSDVRVTKEYVSIELCGGFVHYGVIAYSENTEEGGVKKLIDGLWYYED